MSKRRAVILSVTIEGRSQAETARLYDVSESFVSRLLARYRSEGDAAFEPRSRKPTNSPTRLTSETVELITNLRRQLVSQGLDAGPETIAWHLATHHHLRVSVSTIRRRLLAAGLITGEPKEAPAQLLHPLRSRPPERDLAVRFHALASSRWHRHRDPGVARRLRPLRPLGHRP